MKKLITITGSYFAVLSAIFTLTAFIRPENSGAFNYFDFSFYINLILINLALLACDAIMLFSLKAAEDTPQYKNRFLKNTKPDYSVVLASALAMLFITFFSVCIFLLGVRLAFTATIVSYIILIGILILYLKKANKLSTLLAFLAKPKLLCTAIPLLCIIISLAILLPTTIIPTAKYNNASALLENNDVKGAAIALSLLNGYKDSNEKLNKIIAENPELKIYGSRVGDTVCFGMYEQDNITDNGKEAIEWIVLEKIGGKLLLISKDCLECIPYNDVYTDITWEKCSLRKWLNGEFINTAFSAEEQAKLTPTRLINEGTDFGDKTINGGKNTVDKVFLLSLKEGEEYLSREQALSKPSEYARVKGVYRNAESGYCWWWMRSPGASSSQVARGNLNAQLEKFSKMGYYVNYSNHGVRPVMWIDITK